MISGLYSGAAVLNSIATQQEATAANLAHLNTAGHRRAIFSFAEPPRNEELEFDLPTERMEQTVADFSPGRKDFTGRTLDLAIQGDGFFQYQTPDGLAFSRNGVRPVGTLILWTQRTNNRTDEPTYMAIEGEGFFKVIMPDGSFAYTRDGSFHVDATGLIVNGDGRPLEPNINIPLDSQRTSISQAGQVEVIQNGVPAIVGNIQLVRFSNPAGLERMGGNLMRETAASGPEIFGNPGLEGLGMIRQGFLEGSNVEVVAEMVNLITAQRAYEINSRAIRAGDEMLANTTRLLG